MVKDFQVTLDMTTAPMEAVQVETRPDYDPETIAEGGLARRDRATSA
ncbi:MAG: hypothetical protein ABEL51_08230 [Salinibacter sp.]